MLSKKIMPTQKKIKKKAGIKPKITRNCSCCVILFWT